MVAKVNSGKNILGILNYNEKKVTAGNAKCIHENLFGQDVATLSFHEKRTVLVNRMNKNRRATTKAVHISLNFHPDEKLNRSTLRDIATTYMNKIGFDNQPYLVYQHNDAAHPHLHIVTTNIKQDGARIELHNIGKNQSETARKEIEVEFRLIRAEGRKYPEHELLKPATMQQASYGKRETKKAISTIVLTVTHTYKFTSLPELNAILGQYNIRADPGKEDSQMRRKRGLLYHVIDKNQKTVGVPIKASSIYRKPTMPWLEKQFKLNKALRAPHMDIIKKSIDRVLAQKNQLTKSEFINLLQRQSIHAIFRKNKEGLIYGITFIDNRNKVVCNGSDLGKNYGAKAILKKLTPSPSLKSSPQRSVPMHTEPNTAPSLLTGLMTVTTREDLSPEATMKIRKKQKRKGPAR